MPLSQQLLRAGEAADLPAGELPAAVAASRGRGGRGGSSSRQKWGGSGCGRGGRVPLRQSHGRWIPPGTAHTPIRCRCAAASAPQVGGAIAGGQILPVGESLAAAHHRQVDVLAIAEHLGHGAAVLVDGLGAERNHRTNRGQGL